MVLDSEWRIGGSGACASHPLLTVYIMHACIDRDHSMGGGSMIILPGVSVMVVSR